MYCPHRTTGTFRVFYSSGPWPALPPLLGVNTFVICDLNLVQTENPPTSPSKSLIPCHLYPATCLRMSSQCPVVSLLLGDTGPVLSPPLLSLPCDEETMGKQVLLSAALPDSGLIDGQLKSS